MTLSLIDIRIANDAPEGFVEFHIRADALLPATCLVVIERPGQDKAFLADDGWQSNYFRVATSVRHDLPFVSCLRLSDTMLRCLETGYNYRITIFDPNGKELGLFVVNWFPPADLQSSVARQRLPPAVVLASDELRPVSTDPNEETPEAGPAVAPPHFEAPRISPPLRQVTRCGHCGGEVFSTLINCPYCGHIIC